MDFVRGKSVCVTGAGGSVGSELSKLLLELGAGPLLAIDNSEYLLYSLLEATSGINGRLGDIRDTVRMYELFSEYKPQIVFNAAALKHVPMLEIDAGEAVKTNVLGLVNVAQAAISVDAAVVVQISSDKAVDPVSVLGRTKQMAETAGLTLNRRRGGYTRVASVRFHNILGSSGSVLPKFRRQAAAGGPITVTHPKMVRWFCEVRAACELLIQCAAHAVGQDGRELYALEVGDPVRIVDLARELIGERAIEIVYNGMRPGERLEEVLIGKDEHAVRIIPGLLGIEPSAEMRSAAGREGGSVGLQPTARAH